MSDEQIEQWHGKPDASIASIIQGLFAKNGESRDIDLINWQYVDCPVGAHVSIAHLSGGVIEQPVALYAVFKNRMLINGKPALGAQSFDTLTNSEFRGRGLFKTLAHEIHGNMSSHQIEIIYGIPNGSSYQGFQKYLNWSMLDPLPMLARPIGFRYPLVLAKLRKPKLSPPKNFPSVTGSRVTEVPQDISDLFARSISNNHTGVIRDFEYLNWRLKRPGATYQLFENRDAFGKLIAFGVYELVLKHGCCLGYLMEIIVDREHVDIGKKLLRSMTKEMKKRGADLIFAWASASSTLRRMLKSSWFIPFPEKLRPIELHFGYRANETVVHNSLLNQSLWSISYLDSDTV
jgi:hypothetical protein